MPLMPGDDPVDYGKPDARAGELRFRVEPLERGEQVLCLREVEPFSIIFDEEDRPAINLFPTEFNVDLRPVPCVFTGIIQELFHCVLEQARVTLYDYIPLDILTELRPFVGMGKLREEG